jgi:hypothetical protein
VYFTLIDDSGLIKYASKNKTNENKNVHEGQNFMMNKNESKEKQLANMTNEFITKTKIVFTFLSN